MNTIGERIKYIRTLKGVTMNGIVEATGINKASISGYENNKYEPSVQAIVKLSKLFKVRYEWLLEGSGAIFTEYDTMQTHTYLQIDDEPEYRRQVLQIDYDREGNRFKIARELAGYSIEVAAAKAYIKVDDLRRLEEESHFSTETADLQQLACLAYVYEVDLYWLFSGKTRPPAPIIKDGEKFYPPYEFMLEQLKAATGGMTKSTTARTLTEDEIDLLDTYSRMDADMKKATHTLMQFQLCTGTNLSYSSGSARGDKKGKLA